MASYIIGDIHGCDAELAWLLDMADFNPDSDRLFCTGDLVNRGPDSLAVLRRLYRWSESVTVVLGNHDFHLLACAQANQQPRAGDTLQAILEAPDRDELLDWLASQPLLHRAGAAELPPWTLVHAGIPPQWSLAAAGRYAQEVEAALRGSGRGALLEAIYGDEPTRWSEQLRGAPRLRMIVNYLTRMRFCGPDGELLTAVSGGSLRPPRPDHRPWFTFEPQRWAGEQLMFGHWAALRGHCAAVGVHALDTGCAWGYRLRCLHLESGRYIECPFGGAR